MSTRASQTSENEAQSGRAAVPQELFKAVSSSRVSQVIVEQIRRLLKEERLQPGDRLPSERELCVQFGVSRVTIREALRILEANGLVEIRVGARGGAL
ncbi:FadR/GntR family transcriptional regulator [Streptomyces malaysiensis subsp. malaysiensis]